MSWEAPTTYADNSELDPSEELDVYEIYVNETGEFSEDDYPAAYVSATDSHGNPTESFDLGNLDYSFTSGVVYYICMRSVTKSGIRSGLSTVFMFTIRTGSDFDEDALC